MFNYLQTLAVLGMGMFLCFAIIPSYPLMSPYSAVYAAVISCSSSYCNGTYGDDNMRGDAGHNTMNGLGGNDEVNGGPGNDFLHGGDGNDQLTGGPGDDILYGAFGVDSHKCGAGTDSIYYFNPAEGDTKSNDCETLWPSNATGVSNENLTGFPANLTGFPPNQTLSATNSSR